MAQRPLVTVAFVAVVWGSIGVLVRAVALPSVAIVAARVTIGSIGLGVLIGCGADRRGARLLGYRPALTIATGVLLAAHWAALFAALQRAPIGTVLLITYLAPVLVAIAAPSVLSEPVPLRRAVALGVAAVGCAMVVGPGARGVDASGMALAGFAALSYAALTLAAKPLAEHYGGLRLAFQQQLAAAVVLAPFALVAPWGPPRAAWGWLVVLGLVHTAAGTALFFWSLARVPATSVGLLSYLEPASAVLFGWVALAERPRAVTLVGGALILGAGLSAARRGPIGDVGPAEVVGAVR